MSTISNYSGNVYGYTPYAGIYSPSFGLVSTPQEVFMQQRYGLDKVKSVKIAQQKKNDVKTAVGIGATLTAVGLAVLYLKDPSRRAKAGAQLGKAWAGVKNFFGSAKDRVNTAFESVKNKINTTGATGAVPPSTANTVPVKTGLKPLPSVIAEADKQIAKDIIKENKAMMKRIAPKAHAKKQALYDKLFGAVVKKPDVVTTVKTNPFSSVVAEADKQIAKDIIKENKAMLKRISVKEHAKKQALYNKLFGSVVPKAPKKPVPLKFGTVAQYLEEYKKLGIQPPKVPFNAPIEKRLRILARGLNVGKKVPTKVVVAAKKGVATKKYLQQLIKLANQEGIYIPKDVKGDKLKKYLIDQLKQYPIC